MNDFTLRISQRDGEQERAIEISGAMLHGQPMQLTLSSPPCEPLAQRVVGQETLERIAADLKRATYTINGDGTVLDNRTGLMWSRDNVGDDSMAWKDADKACKKLRLAGHSDWRLPTREELLTLVDDTRHAPAIDANVFPDCKQGYYWTATPAAWSPSDCAWLVGFNLGDADSFRRGGDAFVRAVRVASPAGQ